MYYARKLLGYETEPELLPEDAELLAGASPSRFSVRSFTTRRYRELVDRLLKKATPAIGEYLFSYIAEPGTESENSALAVNWQATWTDMEADLTNKLRKKLGVNEDHEVERVRALRLQWWTVSPPSAWPAGSFPKPFAWLRATLLHLLFPADEEPNSNAATIFMVCNLCVSYQIANWTNLLRLALIDRTDEFQLISFVIANRAYHFIDYGLVQLFQNQFNYFSCVMDDVDPNHPCSTSAPGRNQGYEFEFVMEILRMASCLWAFSLLRYSDGGKAHLYSLEIERLGLQPRSKAAAILHVIMMGETAEERALNRAVSAATGVEASSSSASASPPPSSSSQPPPRNAPLAKDLSASFLLAEQSSGSSPGGQKKKRHSSWTRSAQTKSGVAVKGGMLRYFIM